MNMFKHCYETGSDFMEMSEMVIFKISDYLRLKELGLPNPLGGIEVVDPMTGEQVGILPEDKIQSVLDQPD